MTTSESATTGPGWRLIPPAWLVIAVGLMVGLHELVPVARWMPRPWNALGVVPMLAGLVLVLACAAQVRRRGTTIKPHEMPTVLITTGAFAVSRNPIYAGLVLVLVGLAILLGTVSPLFVIPLFGWLIQSWFIAREEQNLSAAFGPAYDDYRKRVRRWL